MARLDFTATNILTASEMDELARQAISNVTNAGKPTGTAEGETVAVTDKDRHEWWNGSAWERGTNWAAAGRTWASMTEGGGGITVISNGAVAELTWDPATDPDGFYTGFSGSTYDFTIPSGLGGIYLMTCRLKWTGSWAANAADRLRLTIEGAAFDFPQQPAGATYVASLMYPMAATDTVSVQVVQNSGGNNTIDTGSTFTIVRLCV